MTAATLADFAAAGGLPGSRIAATAAGYVRENVRSPMETRLRMLIVLAGLPEPHINALVGTGDGMLKREHDLVYAASKTAVEYDGQQHAVEQCSTVPGSCMCTIGAFESGVSVHRSCTTGWWLSCAS